ncbi:MAG: hypothetical protein RR311_08645, partial [Comamonas sp.]
LGSRIWDKISDFFCGTQREEAKKHLFDLFSPDIADKQKIKAFSALKDLAGDGYKDRFQHSVEGNRETYALMLDGDAVEVLRREIIGTDKKTVSEVLNSDRTAELGKQLELDIVRGQYTVGGQALPDNIALDLHERIQFRLELFDKALDGLQCNAQEKKSIYALSTQGTVSLIMQNAEKKISAEFPTGVPPQCPVHGDKVSAYSITREDGVMRVKVQFESDMAALDDEEYLEEALNMIQEGNHIYKSLQISLDVAIDANGNAEIMQLDYLANKGLETA